MKRILFVANGHGETAIAARIATAVRAAAAERCELQLFPLVGLGTGAGTLEIVGPRRAMPSGGLVAMGNVRAFAGDLRAGFALLLARQLGFLRGARDRYDAVAAVGDAYALALACVPGAPVVFVGTAKSAYVAPYGPFERVLMRRAARAFVRDEPTARALSAQRTHALAAGNVIVDLASDAAPHDLPRAIGIFPGSRADAYADGIRLGEVVRALARRGRAADAMLSIAPTLDARTYAHAFEGAGWQVERSVDSLRPFTARADGATLSAWTGTSAALLRASTLVLGQAGTANEQAAACGIPVAALARDDGREPWYRMRQRKLLGDALCILPADPEAAAGALDALLRDDARLARMREAGPERMGPPGGAAAIARAILEVASAPRKANAT